MNAIVAEQWLLRNEDFKLNRLLAKVLASRHIKSRLYHRHIHASRFRTVQKQKCKILILATLTLETGIGRICNTHGYQGEACDGLEMKLT